MFFGPNCDPNSGLKITWNDCQTQTQQFHPRILFQNSSQPHSTPRGLPIHSACLSTSLGWYGAKLWGYAFGYGINQHFFWPMMGPSCKANLPFSYGNLERYVSRCWYQTTCQNTSGFETEEPQPHPSTKLALNVCMKYVCLCLFLMANPNVSFPKQLQCLPTLTPMFQCVFSSSINILPMSWLIYVLCAKDKLQPVRLGALRALFMLGLFLLLQSVQLFEAICVTNKFKLCQVWFDV